MRSELYKLALVLLGLFGVFSLTEEFKSRDKSLALFLDAREVHSLCASAGYPEQDFWERARIVGMAGAVFRAQDLGQLIRRGKAHVNLQGSSGRDSLWMRDPALTARVLAALERRGFTVHSERRSGMQVVELPERLDPESLDVEFDVQAAERAAAQGLAPAFYLEDYLSPPSLSTAVASGVCLLSQRIGPTSAWVDLLRRGRFRPAFANAGDLPPALSEPRLHGIGRSGFGLRVAWRNLVGAQSFLLAGEMDVREGVAALWREAFGRGNRMVLVHLDLGRGVEDNFDALRGISKPLRRAGYYPGLPLESLGRRFILGLEIRVRYVLALLLAFFGPILSVRQGIRVLRFIRKSGRWPLASPVVEVAAGVLTALGLASAVGLLIHALLSIEDWRLGVVSGPWDGWVIILPLMIAGVSLYASDAAGRRIFGWRLICAVLAASLLLCRLRTLEFWGGSAPVAALLAWIPSLWWLVLRWREVLVGIPCLLVGLWLCFLHLDSSKDGKIDPRPWLLLSLIPAVSIIEVLARTQVPFEMAVFHTLEGAAMGFCAGLAVLGLRYWAMSWRLMRAK